MHSEPTKAQATAPAPRRTRHALDALLAPRSVAVVGAAEEPGSLGRALLWNLISSPFGGTVYPVTTARTNVLGIRAYPSIESTARGDRPRGDRRRQRPRCPA